MNAEQARALALQSLASDYLLRAAFLQRAADHQLTSIKAVYGDEKSQVEKKADEQDPKNSEGDQPSEGAGGSFIPVNSDAPAWERLISHTLLPREIIPLIETIFTSEDEVKMILDLGGHSAQAFVNAIHEVCFAFFPSRGTI